MAHETLYELCSVHVLLKLLCREVVIPLFLLLYILSLHPALNTGMYRRLLADESICERLAWESEKAEVEVALDDYAAMRV